MHVVLYSSVPSQFGNTYFILGIHVYHLPFISYYVQCYFVNKVYFINKCIDLLSLSCQWIDRSQLGQRWRNLEYPEENSTPPSKNFILTPLHDSFLVINFERFFNVVTCVLIRLSCSSDCGQCSSSESRCYTMAYLRSGNLRLWRWFQGARPKYHNLPSKQTMDCGANMQRYTTAPM